MSSENSDAHQNEKRKDYDLMSDLWVKYLNKLIAGSLIVNYTWGAAITCKTIPVFEFIFASL